MTTLQAIVDLAREPLNDADKDRYTDAQLLLYTVHGLLTAYRNRYDLFMGGGVVPTLSMTLASTFPLPDEFVQVIADYVTARAESRDDEHVNSNRMAGFATVFSATVPG